MLPKSTMLVYDIKKTWKDCYEFIFQWQHHGQGPQDNEGSSSDENQENSDLDIVVYVSSKGNLEEFLTGSIIYEKL